MKPQKRLVYKEFITSLAKQLQKYKQAIHSKIYFNISFTYKCSSVLGTKVNLVCTCTQYLNYPVDCKWFSLCTPECKAPNANATLLA